MTYHYVHRPSWPGLSSLYHHYYFYADLVELRILNNKQNYTSVKVKFSIHASSILIFYKDSTQNHNLQTVSTYLVFLCYFDCTSLLHSSGISVALGTECAAPLLKDLKQQDFALIYLTGVTSCTKITM